MNSLTIQKKKKFNRKIIGLEDFLLHMFLMQNQILSKICLEKLAAE